MIPRKRRLGLIGDPVEHSLSPRMHAAGFAALGIDAEYVRLRVPAGPRGNDGLATAVERAMRELGASGGGNVTVPHKGRAAGALDEVSEAVRRTGACNCFWMTAGKKLAGDNTDVTGIASVLNEMLEGRAPVDVLVLGAGGAAAAAALAAARLGAPVVRVANRTPARASRLVGGLRESGIAAETEPWPVAGQADVIVNATTLGLAATDPLPASFDHVTTRLALDLVYPALGEAGTAWTRAAAERGIQAADGLEVLVRQGAACYPHWFGVEAPLAALRGALAGPAP